MNRNFRIVICPLFPPFCQVRSLVLSASPSRKSGAVLLERSVMGFLRHLLSATLFSAVLLVCFGGAIMGVSVTIVDDGSSYVFFAVSERSPRRTAFF